MIVMKMMIASYMDDDDSIVYGGDFLVTQQDKRILGVRMKFLGTDF